MRIVLVGPGPPGPGQSLRAAFLTLAAGVLYGVEVGRVGR